MQAVAHSGGRFLLSLCAIMLYMEQLSTTIRIEDDFDLEKIALSGQCFRVGRFADGIYRFITGNDVLYIRQHPEDVRVYDISCSENVWRSVWVPYFDLERNYSQIRADAKGKSGFLDQAMDFGEGVRVLKQDPWEMLITFIISQRKNIPAISKSVNLIAERYGTLIETPFETVYTFPTPEALASATDDDLRACSLGYRAPYVADAAQKVCSGDLDLAAVAALSDEELFEELQRVHGVGKKVSNCVCLFAYGRVSMVPVDVWIARAIEQDCKGEDPFAQFGGNAGIMQQFAFYFMTNREK